MIEAKLSPSSPTATQVVVFGAHETARTFVIGTYEAAVCHVVAAAAEGAETGGLATTIPIASRIIAAEKADAVMLRTAFTAPPPFGAPRYSRRRIVSLTYTDSRCRSTRIPDGENGVR
jgi:hypothetical protein